MAIDVVCDIRHRFGPARDQGMRPTCLAFAVSDAHAERYASHGPHSHASLLSITHSGGLAAPRRSPPASPRCSRL